MTLDRARSWIQDDELMEVTLEVHPSARVRCIFDANDRKRSSKREDGLSHLCSKAFNPGHS